MTLEEKIYNILRHHPLTEIKKDKTMLEEYKPEFEKKFVANNGVWKEMNCTPPDEIFEWFNTIVSRVDAQVKVNFAEVIELIDAMIVDMNGWEPIVNDYDKGFDKGYKNALTSLKEDISKISA